jgi:hypothetical protein
MRPSRGSPAIPGRGDALRSWGAVVLMVAVFVTIASVMNRLDPVPSFFVSMSIFGTVVAVLLVLAGLAIRFGVRARRAGNASGILPAAVGGALGGFALLLAVAPLVGHLFGFE